MLVHNGMLEMQIMMVI